MKNKEKPFNFIVGYNDKIKGNVKKKDKNIKNIGQCHNCERETNRLFCSNKCEKEYRGHNE